MLETQIWQQVLGGRIRRPSAVAQYRREVSDEVFWVTRCARSRCAKLWPSVCVRMHVQSSLEVLADALQCVVGIVLVVNVDQRGCVVVLRSQPRAVAPYGRERWCACATCMPLPRTSGAHSTHLVSWRPPSDRPRLYLHNENAKDITMRTK